MDDRGFIRVPRSEEVNRPAPITIQQLSSRIDLSSGRTSSSGSGLEQELAVDFLMPQPCRSCNGSRVCSNCRGNVFKKFFVSIFKGDSCDWCMGTRQCQVCKGSGWSKPA